MGGFCRKRGTFGLFAVNTAADAVHTEGGHGWTHAQRKRAFGKGTIVTSSNQSVSAERGALKVFGVLFIVLGSSVNWLGWIVFAVTVAAAIYATKIRKDARNA